MTDKYIFYEFDGERYKVPVSEQKEFEKQAPTAKIMLTYDKENYKVPLGELGGFLQETGVDKVTYSAFDDKKQYSPNMSTERYVSFDEPAVPKVASETQPSYAEPDKFDWSATSAEMPMSNREQRRARRNMESYLRRAENEEYANAVIDSHNENKKAAEEYIERIDKEFSAYESEEPEKTFWQKLSESMRQAKAEQRLGASAFNAEQKKSDIKKGQNYVDAKIAKNIESKVEDKIKEYNDPAKTFVGGVAHGLRDTVFDIDTWDSTVGAEEAARVYSITKKLDNGEKLTEGEQLIVDALVDDLSSDIYLASEFGRGYKAGKVTGESLPFMLETAINPASGFGKSFTKKFGKEIFKRVSQKLGSKVARAAVHGTRVATDIAGAAMMSATTSQARVAEDALNRLSGQVDFSMADDGTLQFNGFTGGEDSAFKAYAKAFGANTIEHFSEMVGNYFAPIGEATKSGAIALANKVGLKRVGQLLDEMTPNGFGALINDFAEQTQWQGVFGEFAEEMVSGALNALVVGDQSLKKYDKHGNLNENYLFDKENMIDTFLGVAILGGTISAAKTLGYTTPETRYNREISRAKKNLRGILSEEEMAQLEAFAANPFGMGAANLTPFFDDNRDDDFKRAVGSYLKAVMEKKGYEISRGANLSGTQQGMNEMRNAFHLGQNMSEADLYDINEAEASAIQALRDTGIFDTMEGAAVPFLTEDALELGSYDLFAMSNDNRYTDEEKEAFRNLAIVRNAKEGLEGMLNARTQAVVDASNRIATDASQDGKLTIGIHNGQIVFIKGGVQVNNGSIVNPNASGGYPVEVVNSMTGEVSLVESSQIENVVTDDVEAYNTRMGGIISEYYQQRQDKWRNTKSAKSKLAEVEGMVGQSVYIDNGNGNNMTEVEIMQILPNGEVVLKGKKGDLGGQSTIRVDVDSFYDSMTRDANGNPIFNQSKFRSQTQNINERRNILYHGGDTTNDVAPVPVAETEESGEESVPEAITEAPVPTGEADYRDGTYTILIDGKPVEVEVYSQDNPSDTVIYSYVDENGNERIGRTTIEGFGRAIQEAQGIQPTEAEEDTEFPAVPDNVPEVVNVTESTQAPQEVPVTPETINWDALFDNDPEAYFSELQNRYGEKTEKMLNAVIAATQKKLDALNKANPDTQEEIFANEEQKDRLQAKIDALKGMIARLAPAENVDAEPVAEQAESETTTEPVVATTEETAPVTPETSEAAQETTANGFIIVDKVITNPEVIEMPNTPNGDANRIFVGEYNGKWTYGAEALMDNGSWGKTPEMRIENARYNTREEAIAGAISFLENQWKAKHKNAGSTALETFIQYVRDNYLAKPSEAEVAPAAEPAKPVAPTPVDDPIREAHKREKSLATQLRRVGIPHEQKQDMAFNAGKAVADFFATREEYEAYAENATDFKEYNADFERGVEASFANRPQITSVSQDNSVPLESEQTPTTNEEQGTVPAEQTGGPGTSSGDRGSDNTRGEEGDSEATEEPPVRESGSGAEESLEDRYPARKGDVTPKMLQETFGFGSVSSALEQSILNSTYDIMMEMSKMLGISPTSMSHGGALTLDKMPDSAPAYIDASYGRNGKYGTPVTRSYIRIRFGRNLSGIAHEWWHSLDHFLKYYNSGRGNELASEIGVDSFDGRKEVIKAIKAVLKAIKNSGHVDRIDGLPLRTSDKKYFKSRKEIIARAFEEYIIGKFAAAGIEIDGVSKDNHFAQPTAEEMAVITPAFDKLFKILLEKEGKKEGTTMLYKIGEYADERLEDISEEAVQLADDTVALMTDEAGIETVAVPDEQIDEMSVAAGVDANFMIAPDKPVFISNAAIAVEAIKQDKATPEQWLKMIEKNGGLKAGEDKWMGLSEWLKASDKKTLTKQEVLDYIHENMIQIEEQHYLEDIRIEAEELKQVDAMNDEFEALKKEAEANGENHIDAAEIAYQLMAEKYGDDFTFGFGVDNGHLYVSNLEAAASITGIQPRPERYINETRLHYTTEGLENPREIALVVPTIDSWGEEDEIHFGDAGNGRAVAWIRFGETEAPTAEYKALLDELDRLKEVARELYEEFGGRSNELAEVERKQDEIREEMRAHKNTGLKVLVIDEIQSKRHQAGREKGYKSDFDFYKKEKESIDRLDAMYERRGELIREKVNNEEQELAEIARLDIALDEVANVRDYDALTAEKDAIIQKRLDRLKELNELNSEINKLEDELAHLKVRYDYDYSVAIPDAPFDKNWQDVAMKRMLRYAAENGYDAVAWTKGEQQAERYGIGKVVSSVGYRRTEDGKRVRVNMRGGESLLFDVDVLGKVTEVYRGGGVVTNGMALSEIVGADLAKQIGNYEGEVDERGDYNIKSEDFRIGGEGMKGFYDKILPAFMNKYGKKLGIKVADINLPFVEEAGRVMHSVPVTQEMKDSVMEGQPMFMKKPNGKVYGWTDGKKIYLTRHGFNPNTRIHEYTHLWANAMMHKNPKGWQSVKDLLRGTPVWNEVMNDANYSSIHNNEDMVASEVLSRISGSKNAAKLERMAQQMVDEAKGTMRKLEARGLVQRMKDALNEFWSWVGTELFGIEKFESVEQVTDRVLWDLMNKTDLGELSEGKSEFSKKSYGKEKPYGQKVRYTPAFLDDIYFRVLSKYHFGKDSSPYVYMDGYIMRLDVPDSEHLKYYRNVEKTDGFGVRFDIFVGNITEEEFNALIEDYERGIPRTKEALSELFEAYRKNRGSELSSDNVHIENIESDTSDGRLYGQASERKDERRTSVSRSNSYLRASEIDSDIFPISRINLLPKTSTSTKLDTEYFDAIEKGKKVRAENIIEDAANSAGYTEAVYHGTPSYGFTEFESKRKSGAIFTTTARNTAANYGGDGKYASVRKINKGIKEVKSAQDVLDNATSVLDQNWRLATHQEKSEVIARVEADAKKVSDKIQELKADFSNTPFELQEAIAWMENIIYDAADGRENGNEGNSLSSMLIDGYKKFKESRAFARQYIQEHYNELTPEQWSYWSYINGFEVGDVAIDAGYSMARAVSENDVATVDGKSFVFIEDLNEQTQKDKNVGTYKLYGNLGSNPLVIDAEKKVWFDLDFNGMKTTDSIAEWAKENGYTSVVFKNIYDYGDLSDVKVFFNPSQLKSADAITYDNDGNIIPPSERFNVDKNDIRYRKADSQNAAVDYLAGDARLAAIQNAVSEDAKKLNVSVTYKTREDMPAGHKNDKGYYNTSTGEIVICTENASSIADAIQTILHEAVAHKGLRQLMGDKFNEFINRVYDSLDAETKANVDELAEKHYNGNKAVAMEEYMATLAETEDFSKNTVWDKIKSIFEDIINTILGRNDIKIGDNELRYILRASYNNMVNPRNMDTIKGWAQDQMMREEYKINEATPELMSRTGVDPTEVSRSSAKAVYDKATANRWNEFQREFQDAYQPVRIAIDAIQQETGNIPIEDYENYLLIQNQSSSRSRVEIDEFARRYYSPIIKQVNAIIDMMLESRGLNKHDEKLRADAYAKIRQYMIAKHGLERNEYYQTHRMRKLTAAEKKKAIKEAQDVYDDMVNQINSDTTLSDAERENQIRKASDELNAALIEIETREVPDVRDYSGLTSLFGLKPKQFKKAEAEAQTVVDQFEAEFGGAADALWDRINSATNKTLRHSYESGLLSRAQYEEIKSMFKFYIPLRGFDEATAEDVYAYARFEGNRFNPAVQTAGGRTSLADDPLAIIINMAESEIAQGNKNRAKIALYNYLINRPITDENGEQDQNSLMRVESVWYIKNTDEHGNEFYTIASPDHEGGETTAEFEERMKALEAEDKAYKSKKGKVDIGKRFQKPMNRNVHYVYLKVNGVEKAIYINGDPKAAEAINGTDKPKPSPLIEKMRDINRLLSSTFTNYSLEFTARNYFRDMIYSHINIDVRESDPAYRKKFRQNWRHNNIKAMLQMLKAYRAGEFDGRPLSEDEAAFVEFMQNGGQTGYTVINSVENHKKDLERAIKNMQKGIERGGVKDSTIFKYTLGAVEMLNEASELVTRFAAFKTSRDMGRDVVRSISDAKEITVNFNTKGAQDGKGWMGSLANYFGWSKFFFNASVQGVQNIKAMAEANKLKFCTTVGGVAAFGFVMPIIASAIAEAMGGDDDEYWNIPEYERQNNFCIPIGGGKYAKIPLPIGFREIYAMGDMVAAMAFNKMSTRDVWQVGTDMANKIASIVLPINPLESSANGLSIWHTGLYTALPSSLQFAIQNATNVDWKGAPLQKEYTYNEDDPQWMKAFASNPDWMVGLSKWCNEHWNLDGDYKGWDWSPEKLDNTLSNLFGGIYSLVKKTGKSISMIWNEENRNLSNIPLSGVVLGSGIDKDDRFVNDVYFEEKDYYDSQIGYIKRRAKKFGYDLEDVFEKEKGKHHPKMMEIYSNKNFDFMQEWYKGNKELEEINNEIKKLEKKINSKDNPSEFLLHKLAKKKAELASERREFVNDMLELD